MKPFPLEILKRFRRATGLIDFCHKLPGTEGRQPECLLWCGGPNYIAVAAPDWQQRQGPVRQEALVCRRVLWLRPHSRHQPPLVVRPSHGAKACQLPDLLLHA